MSEIKVHPRVMRRHGELSEDDVLHAVKSIVSYRQRRNGHYAGVGLDGNGRLVEMVYIYDAEEDVFFVFHAMTPPTVKLLAELKMTR